MPRPQLGTDEIDRVLHACCGRFGGPDGYHTYCKGLEVVLDALMGLARLLEDATAAALWAVAPALGLFKNNVNLDRRPALSAASATPASATAKPGPPAPSGRHGRSTTSCWQQQKQQAGSRRRCTSAAAAAPRGQLASWCRTGALDATIARAMGPLRQDGARALALGKQAVLGEKSPSVLLDPMPDSQQFDAS